MANYRIARRYPSRKWEVLIQRAGVSATVWDGVTLNLANGIWNGTRFDSSAPRWKSFRSGQAALSALLSVLPSCAKVSKDPRHGWTVSAPTYGNKRDYPKINIYRRGAGYVCSTTWAGSCREAVARYALAHCIPETGLFARFAR